ncbi:MAG: sulfatase-like hydrolase/transferase [Candidatus Micrarchaeota archaeon]|nr:sulfatase-like hydrolase/transferase [Candidatus Micrarchaeota archaeon]
MKKNVIVILMDTARASDIYGNSSLGTLDGISRNATKYECAVSPGTWTAPAHAALFTDRRVSKIRHVSKNFLSNGTYKMEPWMVKTKFLGENTETIAKKVSVYGYQSVLLSNNPFLTSYTNLALGFDRIHDIWLSSNVKYNRSFAKRFNFILDGGASSFARMMDMGYAATRWMPSEMMDKVYIRLRKKMATSASKVDGTYMMDRGANDTIKLLEEHFTYNYNYKPQFMFINYMEAHENYPVNDMKVPQDKWLYLSGLEEMSDYNMHQLHIAYLKRLKYLDRKVNATISMLKEKGILDNATIIITSDHGQFFGEHNMLYHSLPPYESVSRVPLIAANYENGKLIRMKDSVDTPVSISALHNSILNLASGRYDYLNGNLRKDRYVFCEHTGISEGWDEKLLRMLSPRSKSAAGILKAKRHYNNKVTAVYSGRMKLIHYFGRKKDELYDIKKDPNESSNVIDSNRSIALSMVSSMHN